MAVWWDPCLFIHLWLWHWSCIFWCPALILTATQHLHSSCTSSYIIFVPLSDDYLSFSYQSFAFYPESGLLGDQRQYLSYFAGVEPHYWAQTLIWMSCLKLFRWTSKSSSNSIRQLLPVRKPQRCLWKEPLRHYVQSILLSTFQSVTLTDQISHEIESQRALTPLSTRRS